LIYNEKEKRETVENDPLQMEKQQEGIRFMEERKIRNDRNERK
jgi:hypothetical protein